jgi:hypothetical protein
VLDLFGLFPRLILAVQAEKLAVMLAVISKQLERLNY